ncbi:hypothetical protein ACE4Z5_27345, partial [Salmonella enterica]|uniref:hypothetical protein n=1 Tax=Salmonella enterica TaxID=28901 RepID=UPI003D2D5F27
EFEAVDEGRIGKILVPEGTEGVAVNTPIAELEGEGAPAKTTAVEAQAPAAPATPPPAAPAVAAQPKAAPAQPAAHADPELPAG